ncbi:hypothetical protein TWF730_001679 [Orbilia blumenaviensis]|uniref:Nucleoside phosphorylase domain-containing protein n=1 Tax=Orbilia blumenaviensis TaxID=1796055 RepID=A0AAV9UJB4_9PEZI
MAELQEIQRAMLGCRQSLKKSIDVPRLNQNGWAENRLLDFNVWATSAGVLAKGKLSLDERLASHPHTRNTIVNLLSLLKQLVDACREDAQEIENEASDLCEENGITSPEIELSLGELELRDNVKDILDKIIRLTVAIRKAGTDARLRRADKTFDIQDPKLHDLKRYLEVVIPPKGPKEGGVLNPIQSRLIEGNLRRRHRFAYAKEHARRMASSDKAQSSAEIRVGVQPLEKIQSAAHDVTALLSIHSSNPPSMKAATEIDNPGVDQTNSELKGVARSVSAPTVETAASAIEGTVIVPQMSNPRAAATVISHTGSKIIYPRPPFVTPDQAIFRCPCCHQSLPIAFAERTQWKKHLAGDILPYICVFEDCPTPLQFYLKREDWERHIKTDHPFWNCYICEEAGDQLEFQDEHDLIKHIEGNHRDTIEADEIPMFLDASKHFPIIQCPLCPSSEEMFESLEHIAQCVHDFSLRSLPEPSEGDAPGDYFDVNSDRSIQQSNSSLSQSEENIFMELEELDYEDADYDDEKRAALTSSALNGIPSLSNNGKDSQTLDWVSTCEAASYSLDSYSVALVCTSIREMDQVIPMLDELHPHPQTPPGNSNYFQVGSVKGYKVVVVYAPVSIGHDRSIDTTASWLLNTFPFIKTIMTTDAKLKGQKSGGHIRLGDVPFNAITALSPQVDPEDNVETQTQKQAQEIQPDVKDFEDRISSDDGANNEASTSSHPSDSMTRKLPGNADTDDKIPAASTRDDLESVDFGPTRIFGPTGCGSTSTGDDRFQLGRVRSGTLTEISEMKSVKKQVSYEPAGTSSDVENYDASHTYNLLPPPRQNNSPPKNRCDFEIAIICAFSLEAIVFSELFDQRYDENTYGEARGDPTLYVTGAIGYHNVVLVRMPYIERLAAASLHATFPGIRLALVVGICGGAPFGPQPTKVIFLGDVVISEGLIYYGDDPYSLFTREATPYSNLKPSHKIRASLAKLKTKQVQNYFREKTSEYLKVLQQKLCDTATYPGATEDRLFNPDYQHKHHGQECKICLNGESCDKVAKMSCEQLKCHEQELVLRDRLYQSVNPTVHFGLIASGNNMMKSGRDRDHVAARHQVIAFENKAAGVWQHFPNSLVIKGVCNYADGHNCEIWQGYAAATAAAATKAFLENWSTDHFLPPPPPP